MSDVSKTNDELEKLALAAEDAAGGPPSAEQVDALIAYADALRDALEAATRERDAAVAATERVRAAVKPWGSILSAAKGEVLAALDGAPEPEWEWEYQPSKARRGSGVQCGV